MIATMTGIEVQTVRFRVFVLSVFAIALSACARHADDRVLGSTEWDRVELIAEVSEPVLEINVVEGQSVAAGELLLALDPRRAQAELAAAEAELARLQAQLSELRNGARPEAVAEANERVKRASSLELNAAQELQRARSMRTKQLNSPADLDRAQNSASAATAERKAARAALDTLLNGTRVEQLDQAQAAANLAAAHRDSAALSLERLTVRAPRAGRIDAIPVRVGDQPARGATVITELVGERAYVRVFVPESIRAGIAPGSRFSVSVEGIGTPFEARVRWVRSDPAFTPYYALTGEDASRLSYLAELILDGDAAKTLAAGLPATAVPIAKP